MATTTNYGWTTPDDTALVKDGASAIRSLGSSVDTTVKALNPETTLGDIAYRSSTANTKTRLGIGTTGQVLTVSGGVPAWATLGATGGMTLLSTNTLSTTSTTISIDTSYTNLQIVIFGVNHSTSGTNITLRFNGVTSGYFGITNDDSSTAATRLSAGTSIPVLFGNGYGTGGENLTNIEIPFYAKTGVRRPIKVQTVYKTDDVTRVTGVANGVYGYANTSAISSITVISSATPTAGTVEIYGVK